MVKALFKAAALMAAGLALFIMTLATNSSKVGMACKNRNFTTAAAKLGKYF